MLYYWQPSAALRAAGARPQRLSDDPVRAMAEAAQINANRFGRQKLPVPVTPYRTRAKADERRGIYVVSGADGYVKIGITDKPQSRLAAIQNGSPEPLKLCLFVHALGRAAQDIEALAHRRLHIFRRSGEWFKCTPETAIKVVMEAWAARPSSTESLNTTEADPFKLSNVPLCSLTIGEPTC